MKSNSSKAVSKLAARSFKQNKKRNIFILIAIFLTTFMITAVLSIAMSFIATINLQDLQRNGSAAHARVMNVNHSAIETLRNHSSISSVGVSSWAAYIELDTGSYALVHFDEAYWDDLLLPAFIDVEGRYPQAVNEIKLSRRFLFQKGISQPEIGMEIPITFSDLGGVHTKIFILSGIYTSFAFPHWLEVTRLAVSDAFINSLGDSAVSQTDASIVFRSNRDIDGNIRNMQETLGDHFFIINLPVSHGNSPVQLIIILAILTLFLMLTGYLLIYNVFNISVANDIRFYGLLKTLGTEPWQLRHIIIRQALRLCFIAIPFGTVLAALLSFAFVPLVLSLFNIEMTLVISFSPLIFIFAPLLSLITALKGASAPAKKVSCISPIEAMRYSGQDINKKRVLISTRGRPFLMAVRNIFFRNKKRMLTVFVSLFFSLALFMTVAVITFSMDAEQYITGIFDNNNFHLRYWPQNNRLVQTSPTVLFITPDLEWPFDSDFDIEDFDTEYTIHLEMGGSFHVELETGHDVGPYFDLDFPLFFNEPVHRFDTEYFRWLESLPGFISAQYLVRAGGLIIYTTDFEPYARSIWQNTIIHGMTDAERQQWIEERLSAHNLRREFTTYVYGIDVDELWAIKHLFNPPIDIEAFERGETALLFSNQTGAQELLEGIERIDIIMTGGRFEFEIAGFASRMFGDIRSFNSGVPAVVVAKPFLRQHADTVIYQVNLRVDIQYEEQAMHELRAMTEHDSEILFSSRLTELAGIRSMQIFFWAIGGSVAGVVGLTGLLNFINVMAVGVMSRKKEFAAMESIGMAKKQVRKMLMYEGAGYAVVTLVAATVFGNIIALNLYGWLEYYDNTGAFNFNYPFVPFIIVALVILLICLISPLAAYHTVNKSTIIERLREGE